MRLISSFPQIKLFLHTLTIVNKNETGVTRERARKRKKYCVIGIKQLLFQFSRLMQISVQYISFNKA